MTNPSQTSPHVKSVIEVGEPKKKLTVGLTTRFLEHFSEQLYSSPNKAFEELLANAWDANASTAYVYLPTDPSATDAAIYVLDNGDSMDDQGLEDLWKVAASKKQNVEMTTSGRAMIGKFGIGKLATYVLANELTYICKAGDGVIRAVTMNYGSLDKGQQNLIQNLKLDLREVTDQELELTLSTSAIGKQVYGFIKKGVPPPSKVTEWEDEFGAPKAPSPKPSSTWTLVVLSALKPRGREIKKGIVKRMIQAALPLGAELRIVLNDEPLASAKSTMRLLADWLIGSPDLKLTEVVLPAREGAEDEEPEEIIEISTVNAPYPCVEIPGIGKVTGRVRLFEDRISGGKSEEHGPSNGFFVNVRGRVTNNDPQFGEKGS